MRTYAFYADAQHKWRADGCNTIVASGVDLAASRAAAEALLGLTPGALDEFVAVDLSTAPPFAVQGHPPVGGRAQSTWPTLGRGGDPLRGM